jgi:hypothetical protein
MLDVDTPHGPARVHLRHAASPRGWLMLGHGAGGGVEARDLAAATEAALETEFAVALVEQPYRVAGRKSSAPARQLDAAWLAVVEHLRDEVVDREPLVTGGPPPARASRAGRPSPPAPPRSSVSPSPCCRRAAPAASPRRAGSRSSTRSGRLCSSSRASATGSGCRLDRRREQW